MDEVALEIFDQFRRSMKLLEDSVIEVATPKSVSCHNRNGEFVCEVLSRTRWIRVQFGMDIGACVSCDLPVHDTGDNKFIPHAQYDAGCFVSLYSVEDVSACRPLMRQALAISMD